MDSGAETVASDPLRRKTLRYHSKGLGVTLDLDLPGALHVLLDQLLAGWKTSEPSGDPLPDITVRQSETFSLSSRFYTSGKNYADIVSMLNEILVALAYAVRHSVTGSALIHAAGHELGGSTQVTFGARKAGKSVLTARLAAQGARIWADDLLLWIPKLKVFKGLGISPRLRRPVLPDIVETLPDNAFLAGEFTCYIRARSINLAAAGTVLKPDRVVELQKNQTLKEISWLKVGAEIERHRIP